jgi:hypothetical protein
MMDVSHRIASYKASAKAKAIASYQNHESMVLRGSSTWNTNRTKAYVWVYADKKHAPAARRKMIAASVLMQTWTKYVSRMPV